MALDFPYSSALVAGLCLVMLAAILLLAKRRAVGGKAAGMLLAAAILLTLAAGGLRITLPDDEPARVYVDISESTRTADYRDEELLHRRLRQLLGNHAYKVITHDGTSPLIGPALLFSDGQFDAQLSGGPIFPVADPALLEVKDSRIVDLRYEGRRPVAIVESSRDKHVLRYAGKEIAIPPGRYRIPLGDIDGPITVSLDAGDAWPENDSMTLLPQPPMGVMRWSCGVPSSDLDEIAPGDIPEHAGQLASCSILLLDSRRAAELNPRQQQAIASWVRNLGGSLIIAGQDDGWTKLRLTMLAEISPLSPDPPTASREWIILLDASGSMAQVESGQMKFAAALAAANELLDSLPPADVVRIGLFSTDPRWVSAGTAKEVDLTPPPNFIPRGPTNLDRALEAVLAMPPGKQELILLSDAEVEMARPGDMAERFRGREIRVSCLMLSDGRGKRLLEQLADASGGMALMEIDTRLWASRSAELAEKLAPSRWRDESLQVATSDPLRHGIIPVRGYNQAFSRDEARVFARAGDWPMAARWQVGLGTVAATACPLPPDAMALLIEAMEREPSDDRYSLRWEGDRLILEGAAANLPRVRFATPAGETEISLHPTAPGRHEAKLPDISTGGHAVVLDGDRIIARRTFSPRYPREFAAIGVNMGRLKQIAQDSGGRIIMPGQDMPARDLLKKRFVSLVVPFGLAGVGLLAGAVLILRRRL